jgi:hypothetical protein
MLYEDYSLSVAIASSIIFTAALRSTQPLRAYAMIHPECFQ